MLLCQAALPSKLKILMLSNPVGSQSAQSSRGLIDRLRHGEIRLIERLIVFEEFGESHGVKITYDGLVSTDCLLQVRNCFPTARISKDAREYLLRVVPHHL